jgi:hypothetical protein
MNASAAPTARVFGFKSVIPPFQSMVKFVELVAVPFGLVTFIGPVAAPVGTVVVMVESVDAVTVAVLPV